MNKGIHDAETIVGGSSRNVADQLGKPPSAVEDFLNSAAEFEDLCRLHGIPPETANNVLESIRASRDKSLPQHPSSHTADDQRKVAQVLSTRLLQEVLLQLKQQNGRISRQEEKCASIQNGDSKPCRSLAEGLSGLRLWVLGGAAIYLVTALLFLLGILVKLIPFTGKGVTP